MSDSAIWSVREATPSDAPAIAALVALAYRVEDFFKVGDRTNAAEIVERLRTGRFLLAEDQHGLAGCVYVSEEADVGYFGMLSVHPRRQGAGLGTWLVMVAEESCRAIGCRAMEIEVVNLREELLPYYRNLGYVDSGTRPFPDAERATQPCHFIVMRKALQPRSA